MPHALRPSRRHSAVLMAALAALLGVAAVLLARHFAGGHDVAPALAAPKHTSASLATARHLAANPGRVYWGAWIGKQLTGTEAPWDMNAVRKFERLTGKGPSIIHFSAPFSDCRTRPCVPYKFPTKAFSAVRDYGAIPFFSWGSQVQPVHKTPRRSLHKIISGGDDAFIRSWARAAARWNHPFFLTFDWEMNGYWFPWSADHWGNKPDEYVKAWRHVHNIFRSVGATNVTWVWCPNVDPGGVFTPIARLYPGDAYVDWTCLNGYNNPHKRGQHWHSFDQLFQPSYQLLTRLAPSKPIMIGEVATSEHGGSKTSWIADFLSALPSRYPRVRGFMWFEKKEGAFQRTPIESSVASRRAFARAIASPLYPANVFGDLPAGRIRPAQ